MQSLPPLSAVRVFEAAARLENFTAAAQELGMTQAAVSYQVKLLEERLGLSLFQRNGRRVIVVAMGGETAQKRDLKVTELLDVEVALCAGEDAA